MASSLIALNVSAETYSGTSGGTMEEEVVEETPVAGGDDIVPSGSGGVSSGTSGSGGSGSGSGSSGSGSSGGASANIDVDSGGGAGGGFSGHPYGLPSRSI